MDKKRSPGPAKQLTNQQIKFSQILVYGVEGIPVSKMEAAKLAGYADPAPHGSRLTNPNHYPLVCAYISNLREVRRITRTWPQLPQQKLLEVKPQVIT